ncbi:MAG TPA: ATP-binding cassette domain-containing protein [Methylomirabilota bacterium]|jgi:ABC-2 type transport system ATP-binding protein|nr:ATP-binding cassette domain-containing protein [Methylomirabilota bacterium]
MIEVDHLTKYYGPVAAIQDVSFSVEKGAIVGFLGPNGAGKTTTMRILACFMPASSGGARVAGYDVFEQSLEVRRRIGYLPENVPLYGDLTVATYLDFVADVKGLGRADRRRRVGEVLARCLIEDVQGRLIGRLSKGYRQRVGLAQALIADPAVLILDEPTIGLDPKQIIEIRSLIKSLAGEHTVILSTHILPEVSMVCEGVIIINRGRIVASGSLDRLMDELSPLTRVQVQVLGPPELVGASLRALPGVLRVEPRGVIEGVGTFVVEADRGRDIRPDIVQLVTQQRWGLLELRALGLSLEDLFIRVVAGEEHEAEPGPLPGAEVEAAQEEVRTE